MKDPTGLFTVNQLDYLGDIKRTDTLKDVEALICSTFDEECIALSGLGMCYLLRPELEKHIQHYGSM